FCGDRNAELWDVALQKRADKVLAPGNAGRLITRQEGSREPAAYPKAVTLIPTYFLQGKPGKVYKSDAPGKRFGHAFHQVGLPLNLVDDDQAREFFQYCHGYRQSAAVNGILKIEKGAWLAFGDHPGKRGLAALPRPQECRNRVEGE